MDDMKREAYMRAREILVSGKEIYICFALRRALADITGEVRYLDRSAKTVIENEFTEFLALNDGVCWVYLVGEGASPLPMKEWHESGWWSWREPVGLPFSQLVTETYIQHIKDAVEWTLDARLRAIDFLLRD